jgi:penicillin-binding protein 2
VRRISSEDRARGNTKTNGLPWKFREHALFIGFAPVEAPRYAMSVIVEHGAPLEPFQVQVARDVLLFAQKRNTLGLPTAYPVASAALQNKA